MDFLSVLSMQNEYSVDRIPSDDATNDSAAEDKLLTALIVHVDWIFQVSGNPTTQALERPIQERHQEGAGLDTQEPRLLVTPVHY
jgi:hypothetical protein